MFHLIYRDLLYLVHYKNSSLLAGDVPWCIPSLSSIMHVEAPGKRGHNAKDGKKARSFASL